MKAKELAALLLQNPEVDVMFMDPNSGGGPFEVTSVKLHTAKDGEYPDDFNMPAGYQFAELTN